MLTRLQSGVSNDTRKSKKIKKKYKIGKERRKTEIFEKNEKVIIRNYNPVITISPVFIDSWNYRGGTRFRLKFSPMFYTIGRRREREKEGER